MFIASLHLLISKIYRYWWTWQIGHYLTIYFTFLSLLHLKKHRHNEQCSREIRWECYKHDLATRSRLSRRYSWLGKTIYSCRTISFDKGVETPYIVCFLHQLWMSGMETISTIILGLIATVSLALLFLSEDICFWHMSE